MKFLYSAFTFVFTLSSILASAQLFTSNQERVYGDSRMISLVMDSVEFDGDSIYYPHSNWFTDEIDFCLYPDSTSFLGKEIRVSAEHVYQFILANTDTLFLDTQSDLGDSDIIYTSSDLSLEIHAMVSEVTDEVIFEETGIETVKTLELQAYDQDGEPLNHPVNNFYFRMGSNSGLLSFPSLLNFPDFPSDPYGMPNQMDLQGYSPGPGVQDFTTFEVYDFQPGDQIHYDEGNSSFGQGNSNQFALQYISRFDYADSILYEVEITRYENGSTTPSEVWIETRTIVRLPQLEIPAGSPILHNEWDGTGDFAKLGEHPEFGTRKFVNHLGPLFTYSEDYECYTQIIDGTCYENGSDNYYKGLGGPYFQCGNGAFSNSWRNLVYFNKSGEEWGSPLSVSDRMKAAEFAIYPNPSSANFSIRYEGSQGISTIRLFDLSGRVIREYGVYQDALSLDGIPSGAYGVEITFDSGNSATQKLIVP